MSSEWAVQRLDQIAEINPTRKVHKGSAVPFVDMAALPQFSRDISVNDVVVREAKGAGAHFQNGDTLLARITPCLENGKTAQVRCLDGDAIAEGSTEFIVLCGKDPADNDYIYYLCREPAFREYAIGRMEGTSGRQRVSWQSIAAYQFAFPSPEERRETARVLSTLDDRITLLRETNATLEAIAQALFKSWFVDFDPVRAKMEGRTPEGMDEATAALFPDGLEMSELGEVPRGWRVMPFSTIVSVTSGKRPEDRADSPSSTIAVPLYGGAGVMGYTSSSLFDVPKILTGRVGTLGKVQIAYPPFWASDNVLVVTPKNQLFFSFAYHWLRLIDVAALNRGSTQPLLTQRDLCAQKGVVPPSQTLEAFEGVATSLNARILANAKQAENLSILRDTLLPRLISGQLRLPEAQAATEAALGGTLSV